MAFQLKATTALPGVACRRMGGSALPASGAEVEEPPHAKDSSVSAMIERHMARKIDRSAASINGLMISQHFLLQLAVHGMGPEPDGEERVGEVLALEIDLLAAPRLDVRAASGNVGDEDRFARLQIGNRFQEALQPLAQGRHLLGGVLLKSLLHRFDDLAALEIAQHVHLHPLDLVGGDHLRGIVHRLLQVEARDVDLEPELLAQAHAHEVELLAAHLDHRLRDDAFALLGGERQREEQEGGHGCAHALQHTPLYGCGTLARPKSCARQGAEAELDSWPSMRCQERLPCASSCSRTTRTTSHCCKGRSRASARRSPSARRLATSSAPPSTEGRSIWSSPTGRCPA